MFSHPSLLFIGQNLGDLRPGLFALSADFTLRCLWSVVFFMCSLHRQRGEGLLKVWCLLWSTESNLHFTFTYVQPLTDWKDKITSAHKTWFLFYALAVSDTDFHWLQIIIKMTFNCINDVCRVLLFYFISQNWFFSPRPRENILTTNRMIGFTYSLSNYWGCTCSHT